MFFKIHALPLVLCAVLIQQAQAHGTITAVTGANGVNGQGFGIIADTPRDGSTPNPFEQDTSVIRDKEIDAGTTGACGRTKAGGNNDVASQLSAASSAGLPSPAADGTVTMNLHQVNQDGAGPYTCDVSADGGQTFQAATVSKNVPGKFSLSLAKAQDFPLQAQMPAGMQCAGGPNGDACIMRCRNSALAGPFGSCVAVSNAGAAGNGTAAAAGTNATAATAATPATPAAADAGAADDDDDDAAGGLAGGLGALAGGAGAAGGLGALAGGAGAAGGLGALAGGAGGGLGALAGGAKAAGAKKGKAGGLKGLLGGKGKKKRFVTSRVVGKRDNFWIDA